MNKSFSLAIDKKQIIILTQFITLVFVASIAPFFHNQLITGSIVNATLFIATTMLGAQAGILVGLIPSVIAMSTGLLPAVLAPMIPFIMLGNSLLVFTYKSLHNRNYWWAVLSASLLKFSFLYFSSFIITGLILKKEIAEQVAVMLSWPQLLTALLGALIAFGFLRIYKR